MSLMNDMLRDLEKRQAPDRSQQVEAQGYGALTQKSESHSSRIVLMLLGVIIVMLLVLAVAWWYLKAPSQSTENRELLLQESIAQPSGLIAGKIIRPSEQGKLKTEATPQFDVLSVVAAEPGINVAELDEQEVAVPSDRTENVSVILPDTAVVGEKRAMAAVKNEQHAVPDRKISAPSTKKSVAVSDQAAKSVESNVKPNVQKNSQRSTAGNAKPEQERVAQTVSKVLVISPEQQDENAADEASKLLQEGDTYKARAILSQFVSTHDVDTHSRALLVGDLIRHGEMAKADALLVDEKIRLSSHLRRLKAHILSQNGQPDEAIAVLNSARPDIAKDPEYHVLLAALYQQQGFSVEAVAAYAELIRYDAEVADWWVGMAIGLDSSQQYPSAKKAYKKALKMEGLRFELADFAKQRLATLGG